VIFELEHGEVAVPGRTLLRDANLWLERGEHVSLVGPNGAGKTTLLRCLTGEHELAGGRLRRGHNVKLGYLSQHAEALAGPGTVVEACQRATGLTPNKARALLGGFLFSGEEADKPLDALSGGERQRLALAILVQSGSNVLILDEPTNHLDVESREALEDALRAFDGSLLLVSHDRALLDAVGSRTVAVQDGTLRTYEGGWTEYLRAREEAEAARAAAPVARPAARAPAPQGARGAPAPAAAGANGNGRARAPSKNEQRRRERLEREVEQAEAALAALEDELADPAAWQDPDRAASSTERHEQARRRVEELYARWEAALTA
jgi:ATP-binding cassette subfamily F protein 3